MANLTSTAVAVAALHRRRGLRGFLSARAGSRRFEQPAAATRCASVRISALAEPRFAPSRLLSWQPRRGGFGFAFAAAKRAPQGACASPSPSALSCGFPMTISEATSSLRKGFALICSRCTG